MSSKTHESAGLSRREFITRASLTGLAALAGGPLLAGPQAAMAQQAATAQQAAAPAPMPKRTFGRSGIAVSILALGGMFDILNNRLMLKQALDWGVTYWDTAEGYGGTRSEEGIGRWFGRSPETRKDVFLVTKLKLKPGEDPTARLNECLARLQTDHVDLFFAHGISDIKEMDDTVRAWAEAMKKAGKIKLFGLSTHTNMEACLEGAAKLAWIDGLMFTYNYRLMHEPRMQAAVEACHQAGIGLTAMKTMGGGQIKSDSETELKMAGRFMAKGMTEHQAKLLAVWEDKRIASICSQMPNLTIMGANAGAALGQVRLSGADRALLTAHAQETCGDYCAGCVNLCAGALGQALPVGDVMRSLMYHHSYQDQALARATLEALPASARGMLGRLDFAPAEAACPRGLPIGRLMSEAAGLLA
jgi:aryl-alcohol dehydrogenase-like predicted oxidoreductase